MIVYRNGLDFEGLTVRTAEATIPALEAGGGVVKDDAVSKAPIESGRLVGTAAVQAQRGGDDTVGVTFDGPYARYQHEHLHFRHPAGGQAKFLEMAMVEKSGDALAEVARVLRETL